MLNGDEIRNKSFISNTRGSIAIKNKGITERAISNCVKQLQDKINVLGGLEKELVSLCESIEAQERKIYLDELEGLKQRLYNAEDQLNEFLTRTDTNETDRKKDFDKLWVLHRKVLDTHHQFYIFKLKLMARNIEDHFKLEGDIKADKDLLREVLHTVIMAVPKFEAYFKFKKKDTGTDYRAKIKHVKFDAKTKDEALRSLTESREHSQSDLGRERVLIAQFTGLAPDQFSHLASQYSHKNIFERTPALRQIFLYGRKAIIILFRDFHSPRLELHGFNLKQGMINILAYLRNRFMDFETRATLVVGQGNHSLKGKAAMKAQLLTALRAWRKNDKKLIKSFKQGQHNQGEIQVEFHVPVEISVENLGAGLVAAAKNKEHRLQIKLPQSHSHAELESLSSQFTLIASCFSPITSERLSIRSVPQSKEGGDTVNLFFIYTDKAKELINSKMPAEEHRPYSQVTIN